MPAADLRDKNDEKIARWGRSQHEGYRKFKHRFVQPAPMLFTQDHHPLWLGDMYRGRSAFLIAGGPSFAALDHAQLRQPGILTLGLNNSPKTFRPNLWVSVDAPDHFLRSIWLDPSITKFAPICHASKFVFNSDTWEFMDLRVGDCPNVVYYKRNEHFKAKQFLWEDCINWGNHKDMGGGRSVMLAALRILFILGVRRVYLLGVDFTMSEASKYHFDQDRNKGSMADTLATSLPLAALDMALKHRQPTAGLVHHSDRGVQYASAAYRQRLAAAGVQPSMSRRGNGYDNAAMESFWSSLKRELGHRVRFATRAEARAAVFEWLEIFYNRERFHSALGYKSPVDFEQQLN